MCFSEQLFDSLIALVFVLPLETLLNNWDSGTLISFLYALSIYLFVQVMPHIQWIFSFWGCLSRQIFHAFLCAVSLYSLSIGQDTQMQASALLKSACTSGFVSSSPQNVIFILNRVLIYLILAQTFRLFLYLLAVHTNAILLFPLRLKHSVIHKISESLCFSFDPLRDWPQMASLHKQRLAKEKFRYLPELCFGIKSCKTVASRHPSQKAFSFSQ